MADVKPKEEPGVEEDDNLFEVICRLKDTQPSNLNEKFESYGMETLEAKVPIIYNPENLEKLFNNDPQEQLLTSMSYQAKSASNAMEGRIPRTRNRTLKLIEVGNEKVLAAGETRERSPVDRDELDDELDEYIKERDRILATKTDSEPRVASSSTLNDISPNTSTGRLTIASRRQMNKKNEKEVLDDETLNQDLDDYMREAERIKLQKKRMAVHSNQAEIMMEMEEDFDNDNLDDN